MAGSKRLDLGAIAKAVARAWLWTKLDGRDRVQPVITAYESGLASAYR